jgi:hypothetical protein
LPPTDTPTALLRTNVPNTAAISPCCYIETWNLPHCQHRPRTSQNIIANEFILSQRVESLASSISFINSYSVLYISSKSAVTTLTGLGPERSGAGLSQNREFIATENVQTATGTQPIPYSWVMGDHSPGTRQLGCEAAHLSRSSYEVRHQWSYTSTAPTFIHGEHRDKPLVVFLSFVMINS